MPLINVDVEESVEVLIKGLFQYTGPHWKTTKASRPSILDGIH
jgi:hypothetical protein